VGYLTRFGVEFAPEAVRTADGSEAIIAMVRKKAPFLLGSIVGVVVLALMTINLAQYLRNPSGLQEIEVPNAEALAEIKERNTANVVPEGVIAQRMAEASFGESKATPAAANPETPTIQIPNTRLLRSEFSPASTSAQWWDDESYQKVNAQKNAGKREEPK
jgi:hypothetical protein